MPHPPPRKRKQKTEHRKKKQQRKQNNKQKQRQVVPALLLLLGARGEQGRRPSTSHQSVEAAEMATGLRVQNTLLGMEQEVGLLR